MDNFEFYNPVKIVFGKDQIKELPNLLSAKYKKILITYGGGSIKHNGVYDQVTKALANYQIFEFGGIEPNPRYETLMKAATLIKENKIDFVLAVGGGSVIDGTKFIVAAVNFVGDPWDILIKNAEIKQALPFGTVLTLPAAGSEMNCYAVITRNQDKLAFGNELLYPKFSILDPTVTYSLPPKQTSNGIVDAFVHVMEQYLTYPNHNPLQDRMAEGILLTLVEEGLKISKDLNDYTQSLSIPDHSQGQALNKAHAQTSRGVYRLVNEQRDQHATQYEIERRRIYAIRANLMWSAAMALNGLIAVGSPGDWTSHAIGHEITALYGLDHGETLAIVLPAVMQVQQKAKHTKLVQYAERVWNLTSGSEAEKANQAILKTRDFFEKIGMKTHLSEYNIGPESVPRLLEQLRKHNMTKLGENGDITLEVSEQILHSCL